MGERLCFVAQYDDRRPNRLWFSIVADDPHHGFPSGESEDPLWPFDLWSHNRFAGDHRAACAHPAFGAGDQAGGVGDRMRPPADPSLYSRAFAMVSHTGGGSDVLSGKTPEDDEEKEPVVEDQQRQLHKGRV